MSRGHGIVQRRILDLLAEIPPPESYTWAPHRLRCRRAARTWFLAGFVYDTDRPTSAQLRAVRRSLQRLVAEGAVRRLDRDGFGYGYMLPQSAFVGPLGPTSAPPE
ncbi:MAG: hypothetical protein ACR2FE_08815 [Aeromicrobium sp.]